MRVLFCKIHCPCLFICFCRFSSHIYATGPLKLENTPREPTKTKSDPQRRVSVELSTDAIDIEQEVKLAENPLRSSLKKPNSDPVDGKDRRKRRVQWIDYTGEELALIKEFESSENEEGENGGLENRGCLCCTIL